MDTVSKTVTDKYYAEKLKLFLPRAKVTTIDNIFEHWIEGGGAELKEKRWSVIKDVLKWTD